MKDGHSRSEDMLVMLMLSLVGVLLVTTCHFMHRLMLPGATSAAAGADDGFIEPRLGHHLSFILEILAKESGGMLNI